MLIALGSDLRLMPEENLRNDPILRLLALAGMVVPLLFGVLLAVAGLLRPGYDHIVDYISELGVGSNAWIMNTNFLLTGFLVVAFSLGLARALGAGKSARAGSVLVGIFGSGVFAAGIFSCDPGCPSSGASLSQQMHDVVSIVAFVAIMIAPIVVSLGMKRDPLWQGYRLYSIATGVAAIAFFFLFIASTEYVGALQRFFVATPFLWIGVIALRLFKVSRLAPPSVLPGSAGR